MAEAAGAALLTATAIGSGIAAEQWAIGNSALAAISPPLIAGTLAIATIMAFAIACGAFLNPALTFALAIRRQMAPEKAAQLAALQIAGALGGAMLAHLAFDRDLVETGVRVRTGFGPWAGEFAAAFVLVAPALAALQRKPWVRAASAGLAILAGYWILRSPSFANPALNVAGAITSSLAGVRPDDAPALIAAQFAGALAAVAAMRLPFTPRA